MKYDRSLIFAVVGIIFVFIGLWQVNPFLFFGFLFYFIACVLDES